MKRTFLFTQLTRLSMLMLVLGLASACGDNTAESQTSPGATPTGTSTPGPSPSVAPGQNISVSIPQGAIGRGALAFGANPLIIQTGATVTWTNDDSAPHTVTSQQGEEQVLNSGTLQPGQTFSHTFERAGTYRYYCSIHGQQSMSGLVQVVDTLPTPGATATPQASPTSSPGTTPTSTPTRASTPRTSGGGY